MNKSIQAYNDLKESIEDIIFITIIIIALLFGIYFLGQYQCDQHKDHFYITLQSRSICLTCEPQKIPKGWIIFRKVEKE